MHNHITQHPVTAVISHRVRPGREQGYETWLKGVVAAAQGFPGHRGVSVIRPQDHQHPEYVSILHFDSYSHLKRWMDSSERQLWIARSRPRPLVTNNEEIQVLTGLETWFSLPTVPRQSPPRYRMAIVTWLGVQLATSAAVIWLSPLLAQLPLLLSLNSIVRRISNVGTATREASDRHV